MGELILRYLLTSQDIFVVTMEQAVAIGIWWVETIAKLGTAPQQRFVQLELPAELYLSGKWDLLPYSPLWTPWCCTLTVTGQPWQSALTLCPRWTGNC